MPRLKVLSPPKSPIPGDFEPRLLNLDCSKNMGKSCAIYSQSSSTLGDLGAETVINSPSVRQDTKSDLLYSYNPFIQPKFSQRL